MAATQVTNPTLLDLAKAVEPDGSQAQIAEILTQQNEMLDDMTWQNGNLITGHKGTIRTGIPEPTFRKYNSGVQPSKSNTAVITANTAMLEAYSEVDKKLADLNGNPQAFRLSEDKAKIQGFNNKVQRYMFFGNEASEPEAFNGLGIHYNSLSAPNAENIIDAGGTGTDNASIWLVVWSPETCFGVVPKNSIAGLQQKDLGEVTVENASGSNDRMQAYRTHYMFDVGLFLKDWRFVVRIANIDKSLLGKDASASGYSGADLPDLMYQALEQVPNVTLGRPAFYMSRNVRSFVRRQATSGTKNSTLSIENVGGKMIMSFQGVPMRRVDALAADESRIV